ncbi:hypothetical protein U1Q18_045598 [Sarracenia purpurea var. burkii]
MQQGNLDPTTAASKASCAKGRDPASPVGNAASDMEKMELDFMKVEGQEASCPASSLSAAIQSALQFS